MLFQQQSESFLIKLDFFFFKDNWYLIQVVI